VARTLGRLSASPKSRSAFGRSGRFVLVLLAALSFGCRQGKAGTPSSALFLCGDKPCDANSSYCEMLKTDNLRLPSTYTCKPLPAACRTATECGCFPKGTRCDYCVRLERDGARYFQRTCIGGY
jgi:hypothetical protein